MMDAATRKRRAGQLLEAQQYKLDDWIIVQVELLRKTLQRRDDRPLQPFEPGNSIIRVVEKHADQVGGGYGDSQRFRSFRGHWHWPGFTLSRLEMCVRVTVPEAGGRTIELCARRWGWAMSPNPVEHVATFEMADPATLDADAFGRWLAEHTAKAVAICGRSPSDDPRAA
jgi:hypothetical protein